MSSKKKSTKSKKKSKPSSAKNSLMRFMGEDSTDAVVKPVKKIAEKPKKTAPPKKKDSEVKEKKVPAPKVIPKETPKIVAKEVKKPTKQKEDKALENEIAPQKDKTPKIPATIVPKGKKLEKSDLTFYKKDSKKFGEQRFPNPILNRKGAAKAIYVENLIANNEICSDMEQGLLLTVEYSGKQNKAYARFYDVNDKTIKFWVDTTEHQPYAIHKRSKEELEKINELKVFQGFDRIESVELEDLLSDKKITVSKIFAHTPNDIGRKGEINKEFPSNISQNSIYNILARYKLEGHWDDDVVDGAWEANIRYHHNFIYDRKLIPGLIYRIVDGKISPIELETTPDLEKQLLKLFADEPESFQEMAKDYMKVFSYPIPEVRRVAFDIEVEVPKSGALPDPARAKQRLTSISFAGSDGINKVYVLWRDEIPLGTWIDDFPENTEIVYFDSERDLLIETFRILWEYPIVISFNGDNFDMPYIFHRAKYLKIPNELNPLEVKRQGGMSLVKTNCFMKHGIHLDLYQIFANRSLKGYAFGNVYERNSLDMISKAFLGTEKIKHDTGKKFSANDIATMDLQTLAYYNMIDSVLTLDLTSFGGNTVWNLMVYLMRITKLPLQDLFRHQISFWIRNILYYEHRNRGYLIPRQKELAKLKPGMGDEFEGGYVFKPVPGVHFDVSVMDFSSLYPTIIKSRNLSYETVMCNHEECKNNLLPNIHYHVCKQKMGIFALVVGFFRDIRVKWYKPLSSNKEIAQEGRNFAKILQSALKVFINGCLPYDEEVIVKNKDGHIQKLKIGQLSSGWEGLDILSVDKSASNFGRPKFVKLIGFTQRKARLIQRILLSDGRSINCTPNHIIPVIRSNSKIVEIEAGNLNIGDDLLVLVKTENNKHESTPTGLADFQKTVAIKIEKIVAHERNQTVYDVETENGWFISTDGLVLHNSYGVFGSPNFPLRCRPVAESTTAIGRYAIQETARKAEELGVRVLYGDTDSVFLQSPSESQIEEMAKWSKEKLDLDLEEEKVYQFLALSQRKKNYVGVYKGGNYLDVKGMSAKKSNTPPFIFKAFDEISEVLKRITTMDEFTKEKPHIIKIARSYLKRIGKPVEKRGFPIEDYAVSTKLTKSISQYTKTIPQHVKAAIMQQNQTGNKVEAGEYVTYVKTRDADRVKPVSIGKITDLDTKKYEQNLQNVLEQLLDALDIHWEEIKGMKRLDAFGI